MTLLLALLGAPGSLSIGDCRVCRALNQTGDLERDCDLFDDGLENASCQ